MADEEASARTTVVFLAVLIEGGLLGLALLLGSATGRPPLTGLEWNLEDIGRGVVATLPLLGLFAVMRRWPIGPLKDVNRFCDLVLRPLLAPCSVVDLLGISVLAGIGEELFFRGVLQPVFSRWMGNVWIGLAIASVLFGLMHCVTWSYGVLAALIGAYFGWVTLVEANLVVVIVAHALYDFLVLLYLIYGFGADGSAGQQANEPAAPP
jgi:uncharacterized protein